MARHGIDDAATSKCGARLHRFGKQRALDFGGELQLALHPRLLRRFAIEPRAFDRRRGFSGDRLERAARGARHQLPLLAAVEVQHADRALLGVGARLIEVPHDPQWRAEDVADAQRDGAEMLPGKIALAQVGDDPLVPGLEHLLRNLLARGERLRPTASPCRARARS